MHVGRLDGGGGVGSVGVVMGVGVPQCAPDARHFLLLCLADTAVFIHLFSMFCYGCSLKVARAYFGSR